MEMHECLKAAPFSAPEAIEGDVIRGVKLIQTGELAEGDVRPWVIDDETLNQVKGHAEERKRGLKANFGHTESSAPNRFIGHWRDLRIADGALLGDLHFSRAAKSNPQGDLQKFVTEMASDAPEDFGVSIHPRLSKQFWTDTFKALRSGEKIPLRVSDMRSADFVDEPAGTDGLFSTTEDLTAWLSTHLGVEADCGCEDLGTQLGNRLRDLMDDSDVSRAAVARAGGISESTLDGIVSGEINCPPMRRLRGFARALGVSVSSLVSAAERDGCNYEEEDMSETTTETTTETTEQDTVLLSAEMGRQYLDAFGAQGAEWFIEQKPMGECFEEFIGDLKKGIADRDAEIADLNNRLVAALENSGHDEALDASEELTEVDAQAEAKAKYIESLGKKEGNGVARFAAMWEGRNGRFSD